MKRITIAAGCVVAAIAIVTALTSAFSGKSGLYGLSSASSEAPAPTTPGTSGRLFALEQEALTRRGISPAHAYRAIGVQSTIAESGLVSEIEGAMANTYGGMWFEPATAKLHIGVTSPASRRTAEAIVARAGLTDAVTETPVRSTWAQILAAQKQWNLRLANLLARAEAQTALAPQSNAMVVTLGSSVPPSERAVIEHEARTASVSVAFAVAARPQLGIIPESMKTECNIFKKNEAFCNKTLTSGVTIKTATGGRCTAGPMAIPKVAKNETYLLTAGHCIVYSGGVNETWYAFNRAGTKEAIGPAAEVVFPTKADVGAIKIDNPGYWVNSGKDPVFADTAEWTKNSETSYPVAGERLPVAGNTDCHEGQTSGQSCGMITAVGVTGDFGEEGTTENLVEIEGAISEGGDSGGPWLFITTKANEALMEGMHVGKGVLTKDRIFYEPLTTAFKELKGLNLELLTTSNENRGGEEERIRPLFGITE
jgi:hypothetical protein